MTGGPAPRAVMVVIPARDEQTRIGACLRSVRRSLSVARAESDGLLTCTVLVANRCLDSTAHVARRVLGDGDVVLPDSSATVGEARQRGVRTGHRLLEAGGVLEPSSIWVLSTDADSVVPPTWVRDVLSHAARGAVAVTGLVELGAGLSPQARAAHARIVAAGLRHDGHDHAYGANLAVRADALLAVGGWPAVEVGEDHALVAALRAGGWPVTAALDLIVRTSARRRPRASGGLGDLLDRLSRPAS